MEILWGSLFTLAVMLLLVGAFGVAYYVSVLMHEVGHLSAAWLVGWTPHALSIGIGQERTLFTLRGVEFQLGRRLVGGVAYATADSAHWMRTKQFLFVMGGPVATAGLAGSFLILAQSEGGFQGFYWILFWLEVWLLITCLWPHTSAPALGGLASDGLLMWQTLRIKKEDIPQLWLSHFAYKVGSLLKRGDDRGAVIECDRWLSLLPAGSEQHVDALDELACAPVFSECKALVPDSLRWIDQAIGYAPDKITLQGTKGSLMVEAGNLTDGIALLEHVRAASDSENDHAICTWYLALAYLKRGDEELAQQTLARAKEKYPQCIVASRLSEKIAAIADSLSDAAAR